MKIKFIFPLGHCTVLLLLVMLPFSGANSPVAVIFYSLWIALVSLSLFYVAMASAGGRSGAIIFVFCLVIFGAIVLLNSIKLNKFDIGAFAFALTIPIIYFVSQVYSVRVRRSELIKTFLSLGVIHGLFALHQLINGADLIWGNVPPGGRPSGIFSWGAPVVGSFVGVSLLFYYLLDGNARKKKIYIFIYSFLFIILIISGNRSLLVVHIVFLILSFVRSSWPRGLWVISISTLIIVCREPLLHGFLHVFDGFLSENQVYRIVSLAGGIIEEQQNKRIATWLQSFCAINDSPILGYAIGSFPDVHKDYLYCATNSEGVMPHPHSLNIELLFYFGYVFGGILLALAIGSVYFNYQREDNIFPLLVLVGFLSPLNVTHGLVSHWWLFLMSIILGVAISRCYNEALC